jgi:hypothetical protein
VNVKASVKMGKFGVGWRSFITTKWVTQRLRLLSQIWNTPCLLYHPLFRWSWRRLYNSDVFRAWGRSFLSSPGEYGHNSQTLNMMETVWQGAVNRATQERQMTAMSDGTGTVIVPSGWQVISFNSKNINLFVLLVSAKSSF